MSYTPDVSMFPYFSAPSVCEKMIDDLYNRDTEIAKRRQQVLLLEQEINTLYNVLQDKGFDRCCDCEEWHERPLTDAFPGGPDPRCTGPSWKICMECRDQGDYFRCDDCMDYFHADLLTTVISPDAIWEYCDECSEEIGAT